MPKMKTNKAAAKRVKKTAQGKVMVEHSTRSHLKSAKSSRASRQDRKSKQLTLSQRVAKHFKKLLPYS